jgi:hypothetical protein
LAKRKKINKYLNLGKPAVELRFETATERFALEHTRIESFPEQINKGKQFAQLLGPLESDLSNTVSFPGRSPIRKNRWTTPGGRTSGAILEPEGHR